MPDVREQASTWIAGDLDEQDKAELTSLLADESPEAAAELADRFARRLSFGTAGLRGVVAAGPNRMNKATVTATTAPWPAGCWTATLTPPRPGSWSAATPGTAVTSSPRRRPGCSPEPGIRVHMLPRREPTPFLAYSIRHFRAAAGVMITASHNPAPDNGYKLYLSDGAQIVPPADTDIEAAIAAIGPLAGIAVAPLESPLITRHGQELTQAYLDAIIAELGHAPSSAAWLRFVYTPLHGVAGGLALRAFGQAGFAAPDVVEAQLEPDPDFPTVRFPNPEEPGALDLAIALARRSGAELVIANDPDGDRLAVAIPDASATGGYRQLTGDQVGALLGAFLLGRLAADPGTEMARQLVVSTVVSGSLLAKIAAAAGAQYARTLTGFKWIVRAADLREGVRFAFGYEEALGYAVTGAVRDKDGISAALAVLSLASAGWSEGQSLQDAYDALEVEHGVHVTAQVTLPTEATVDVMSRLRAAAPPEMAGLPVTSLTDYSGGSWELPSTDMLSFELPGARVVIRPSGTEPKVKAYLEVVELVAGRTLDSARQSAGEKMDRLRAAAAELLG